MSSEFACDAAIRLNQRVLIAGCGYLGVALGRLLHALGWEVTGITRSQQSAQALQSEPFRVLACDITDRAALTALGSWDAVVACASSGRAGADTYRQVYLEGMRNLIEVLRPERLIFTSSTSVYAQTDGAVVTEDSPAEPLQQTGQILRESELLTLAAGGTVARLGGIYGPERWALLERFRNGTAMIEGDGMRFLNQIHRADAAAALGFLLTHPVSSGIYNVVDDSPTRQLELYSAFAAHFQPPLPSVGTPDLQRKRGWTSKQVSNAKLRALGWTPIYPSFREALPR